MGVPWVLKGIFRSPKNNLNLVGLFWLRGLDLNQRPLGYEPNELPGCSTPHFDTNNRRRWGQTWRCSMGADQQM